MPAYSHHAHDAVGTYISPMVIWAKEKHESKPDGWGTNSFFIAAYHFLGG
jgi:hypothetical protein